MRLEIKTWKAELAVVATVLSAVVIATGAELIEWLGAAAVTLTFAHAQVADRLAERDAAREKPSVECHMWATRYLMTKECLWLVYFIMHQSWSALAGVGLFLAFPVWRGWWRKRKPFEYTDQDRDIVLNSAARRRITSLRDSDPHMVEALRTVVKQTGGWPTPHSPVDS